MKTILILLSVVSVAFAGVGVLTPEIEAKALALWEKFCAGASEGGNDEGAFIYCKRSPDTIEETLQHEAKLESNPDTSEQVIFVAPPSYHYKHDVVVSGGGASGPKTVIYVKPAKNTHEVNVQDNTAPGAAPQKPQLFFLKGSHGVEGEAPAAAPVDAPAAARKRRHHIPGHEGHGDEDNTSVSANSDGNAYEINGKDAVASPTPVVYILRMNP